MLEFFRRYTRVGIMMCADLISVYGILVLSMLVYKLCGAQYSMYVCVRLLFFPFLIILLHSFSRLYGGSLLYPGAGVNKVEELKRVTICLICGYLILFAYFGLTRTGSLYSRLALFAALLLSVVFVPVFRHLIRRIFWQFRICRIPILIAGAGETGRAIAQELQKDYYNGFEVIGFTDDFKTTDVIGSLPETVKIAEERHINYLFVCLPPVALNQWLPAWLDHFQHILLIPDNRIFPILWSYPVNIAFYSGLEIGNRMKMKLYRFYKAATEVCLAGLIIPMILPICLLIALLVKLSSAGPVFYRAHRLGLRGKPINILKFRTMYVDADKKLEKLLKENPELKKEWDEKFKLSCDPRITPLGNFLRRTSLDELPQFWNVIKGEMSVIGPRPIVEKEKIYYGNNLSVFSRVKPGITGLWQVSGRSETTYTKRVELDVYYVNNWSVWLDYFIFLKTIREVILRNGAK